MWIIKFNCCEIHSKYSKYKLVQITLNYPISFIGNLTLGYFSFCEEIYYCLVCRGHSTCITLCYKSLYIFEEFGDLSFKFDFISIENR